MQGITKGAIKSPNVVRIILFIHITVGMRRGGFLSELICLVRWRITQPAHSAFPGAHTSATPTARPTP